MEWPFHYELKVRSYNLDSFGHVNNAVYFNYLEEARCDYMESRGLSFNDFEQWKSYAFVVSAEIKYKSPARYGDVLDIRGGFSSSKRTSFTIDYQIFNTTTNKICATAQMTFAFVNDREKLIPIPKEFREKMKIE